MKDYNVAIDGQRLTWPEKIAYMILGFFLGIIGILIDWALGHKKGEMECSAEAIWLGIIGCSIAHLVVFALIATGAWPFAIAATWTGWHTLGLVAAICFLILSSMWVYGLRYKQTPEEQKRVFHGDDWIKPGEKHLRYNAAITIDASPEHIWPYIRQAGQERAGWYSFDWLERLCTFNIHNHYDIHPEWQDFEAGHFQWFHQAPLSIGEWVTETSNGENGQYYFASHSDTDTDPTYKNPGPNQEKALRLWFKRFCWTWNWELAAVPDCPDDAPRTRLLWRCDCTFDPYTRTPWSKYFVVFILGTASIVMGRNFMDVMKKLCEGRLVYGENKR